MKENFCRIGEFSRSREGVFVGKIAISLSNETLPERHKLAGETIEMLVRFNCDANAPFETIRESARSRGIELLNVAIRSLEDASSQRDEGRPRSD